MQYKIRKLDGRYTHREYFEYCLIFLPQMAPNHKGVLWFNDIQQWFTRTYGYTAEIRDWSAMLRYYHSFRNYLDDTDLPDYVNFHWSWTNGYDDLRIYVKGTKELTMFKLANPVDSKEY